MKTKKTRMVLKQSGKIFLIKPSLSGRPHRQKVCEQCGKNFLAARSTAKFCSDSCKTQFYYEMKDYRLKYGRLPLNK